jgi:transcriptional regulator with XRE-family HTH domain
MNTSLQKNIKTRLREKNITTNQLEKLAGLKASAVRNILLGRSKNPSANLLLAISEVLECSITDLLGTNESPYISNKNEKKGNDSYLNQDIPYNKKLILETINTLESCFLELGVKPNAPQFIFCLKEIYLYSIGKHDDKIDKKFAHWLVENKFKSKMI